MIGYQKKKKINTYHFLKRFLSCMKLKGRKSHFFLMRDAINATKYSKSSGSSMKKGRFL